MKIKKRHVWNTFRVEFKPASIELRERKALETGSFLVFVGIPILCCLWMLLRPNSPGRGQADWPLFIVVGMSFIGIPILILYRPPRVLCLYPLEKVAYQHRTFLFIRFFGRWHDLSQATLVLRRTNLVVERDAGIGSALLVIPMLLLGPLGIIIALCAGGNARAYSTFALTYKGQRGKPLAVIINRTDGQKAIDSYNDAV